MLCDGPAAGHRASMSGETAAPAGGSWPFPPGHLPNHWPVRPPYGVQPSLSSLGPRIACTCSYNPSPPMSLVSGLRYPLPGMRASMLRSRTGRKGSRLSGHHSGADRAEWRTKASRRSTCTTMQYRHASLPKLCGSRSSQHLRQPFSRHPMVPTRTISCRPSRWARRCAFRKLACTRQM